MLKPEWATEHGTKGWLLTNAKGMKVKLLNPGVWVQFSYKARDSV